MTARIISDPEICAGEPIIRGTRMRVFDILGMLKAGATEQEILEDFRYITAADIQACRDWQAQRGRG